MSAKLIAVSIHAPNEGSDLVERQRWRSRWRVSIHAPNEGSDDGPADPFLQGHHVSIHAPNEGSDGVNMPISCS